MNINNIKYFDIKIEKNTFYVNETLSKPKTKSILKKIERVIRENLTYSTHHKDAYSQYSKTVLLEIFRNESKTIYERQSKKLLQSAKTPTKKITAVYQRICNYTSSVPILPLSKDLIHSIISYLELSDLVALAQVNVSGKTYSTIAKARELGGYKGLDYSEAATYLEQLHKEIDDFCQKGWLPPKYISYNPKKNTISWKKALLNLKDLVTSDLFIILSRKELYTSSFKTFRNLFEVNAWKISKRSDSFFVNHCSDALLFATENDNEEIVKLILQHAHKIFVIMGDGFLGIKRKDVEKAIDF